MKAPPLSFSAVFKSLPLIALFVLAFALLINPVDSTQAADNAAPILAPSAAAPLCSVPETETIRGKSVTFDQCLTRAFTHGGNDYAIHVYYRIANDPANDAACTATELSNGRCEHEIADVNNANLMAQEAETAFKFYTDRNLDFAGNVPLPNNSFIEVYIAEDPRAGGIPDSNSIQVDDEWVDNNDQLQKRLLAFHEIKHLVQIQYDSSWNSFYGEGTARAIEDRVDTALDADTGHLFIPEVNGILGSNANRTSDISTISYPSVLWWTWLMDIYRTTAHTDPPVPPADIGWDAMRDFYIELETDQGNELGVLNDFIVGQGGNFRDDFIDYTLALWAFKFNPSDPRLGFIDAEITNNANQMSGHTVITTGPSLGTVSPTMSPRSSRYYEFNPGNQCDFITFDFDGNGKPYGFSVMTADSGNLQDRWTSYSNTFTRTVRSTDLDRVVGVVTAFDQNGVVDVGRGCVNPTLNIKAPTTANFAMVGLANNPRKFIVRLEVTASGAPVAGLIKDDFDVTMNLSPVSGGPDTDVPATIVTSSYVDGDYWLLVQAPSDSDDSSIQNGLFYDLTVALGSNDDTEAASTVYLERTQDVEIVIDRSGSMGGGTGKLQAAKNAANLLVNQLTDNDQGGYTAFDTDADLQVSMDELGNGSQRTDLENAIQAEVDLNLTSIGDGMRTALNDMIAEKEALNLCSFVLLSDGHENESEFWATVAPDIASEGCPVHTIALGPGANEVLMQSISATVPGGTYDYATDTGGVPINPTMGWENSLSRQYSLKAKEIAGQELVKQAVGFGTAGFGPADVVDFGDQAPGTQYAIGDSFTTVGRDNGTPVDVDVLALIVNGAPATFGGPATINNTNNAGGQAPPEAFLNNTRFDFDFGSDVTRVTIQYADFGGSTYNLSVDGVVQEFQSVRSMDGAKFKNGDVLVSVSQVGPVGELVVDGSATGTTFRRVDIGGPELAIDDIAFEGARVPQLPIPVDDASDLLEIAVAWQNDSGGGHKTRVIDPLGNDVDPSNKRIGGLNTNDVWEIPKPMEGIYLLEVLDLNQQFMVVGTLLSHYQLHQVIGVPINKDNQGSKVPIVAMFTGPRGPIIGATVESEVTDPNGLTQKVILFDDGNHGDSEANDGVYANTYMATSQADVNPTTPPNEGAEPQVVGSYRVRTTATRGNITREAEGYFAIRGSRDSDLDGIPDIWEIIYGTDPNSKDSDQDPDMDGLTNECEYQVGTDPHNSDTDGGGESDGSEVARPLKGEPCRPSPRNPLDPSDDMVVPFDSVIAYPEATQVGQPFIRVVLQKPMMPNMVCVADIMRRTFDRNGGLVQDWTLVAQSYDSMEFFDAQVDNDLMYEYKIMPIFFDQRQNVFLGRNIITDKVVASNDPYAPSASLLINGGDLNTTSQIVELEISVDDLVGDNDGSPGDPPPIPGAPPDQLEMRVGNSIPELMNAQWVPYKPIIPAWDLGPQSDGDTPTVYGQVRDPNGNESDAFDSIVFIVPPQCNGVDATRVGTDGDDIIIGTPGNDVILGLNGADIIIALGGDDIVCGGRGPDGIYGGDGADTLFGEQDTDFLSGGDGNDILNGGPGDDILLGFDGKDEGICGGGSDYFDGGPRTDRELNCEILLDVP